MVSETTRNVYKFNWHFRLNIKWIYQHPGRDEAFSNRSLELEKFIYYNVIWKIVQIDVANEIKYKWAGLPKYTK